MPVPFVGRLDPYEYTALIGSFILVGLEAVIRILTLALPNALLNVFYYASQRLFNRFTSPAQKKAQKHCGSISKSISEAPDFVSLCALFGYTAEEHIVLTKDGYLLAVHRLARHKEVDESKVNCGPGSVQKPIAYLHHGLIMNSEVWVSITDEQRNLPFVLAQKGFDVWLGNNRGNKYSKKSTRHSPSSHEFWDFSIDEFAFYDIPDTIHYILDTTLQPSLSYIGFSQGTAQAFATLSVHPRLNDRINVFIALAPAMSPAGLSNGIVDALVKASPSVLFLLFGRRSILASTTMWQSILYPPIFIRLIDTCVSFLFNWQTKNISLSQKLAAYPHLFSFSSVKSVVHWFQIIRNKSFQMYDDDVQPPLSTSGKFTKVARYPTRNIKTPIVLIYGESDSLVDIDVMKRELPRSTMAIGIPSYEHLDFLWARDVDSLVFPHVFDALDCFTNAQHTEEKYESYRRARHQIVGRSSSFIIHRPNNDDAAESDVASLLFAGAHDSGFDSSSGMAHRRRAASLSPQETSPSGATSPTSSENPSALLVQSTEQRGKAPSEPQVPPKTPIRQYRNSVDGPAVDAPYSRDSPSPSPTVSQTAGKSSLKRRDSGSGLSVDSPKDGKGKGGGIRIGVAKPASGVVTGANVRRSLPGAGGS